MIDRYEESNGGSDIWIWIVVGLVGLLIVVGIVFGIKKMSSADEESEAEGFSM